jgi:hypothetical protein
MYEMAAHKPAFKAFVRFLTFGAAIYLILLCTFLFRFHADVYMPDFDQKTKFLSIQNFTIKIFCSIKTKISQS